MKNNKLNYLLLFVLVILFIFIFIYQKSNTTDDKTDQLNFQELQHSNSTKKSFEITDPTGFGLNKVPKWARTMMSIDHNPSYTREDKIQKLVELGFVAQSYS